MSAVFVWTIGDLVGAVVAGLTILIALVFWACEWWNEYYGGRK